MVLNWVPLMMLAAGLAAPGGPSASVELSPKLAAWKKQIESIRNSRVVTVRIYTDTTQNRVVLPQDAGERAVLRRYFLNSSFTDEFTEMHAANINHQGPEGLLHFVLLNMARASEWGENEEAVLAHEFGHVWLYAANYPFPRYEGRPDSCLAIQAGDAVQHVVIRDEIRRHGIAYLPYWTANLTKLLEVLEKAEPGEFEKLPACRTATQLVAWLDVRLGLSPDTWGDYNRFLAANRRSIPELEPQVEELAALLEGADLRDQRQHEESLRQVLGKMYRYGQGRGAASPTPLLRQ